MRRPWQIWFIYALGLAGVVAAFGWLTVKAIELDRAESLARRQAELEEDVSRALWRMDALLTPLLAEEAARPDFVYRAVIPTDQGEGKSAKGQAARELSPLLAEPPEYVLLHFEVHSDGEVFSPQCPSGPDSEWAVSNGVSRDLLACATERLTEIKPDLSHETLLAQLPAQALPGVNDEAGAGRSPESRQSQQTPIIANNYGYAPSFEQQAALPNAPPQPPAIQQDEQRAISQRAEPAGGIAQAAEGQQAFGAQAGSPLGGYGGGSYETSRLQQSQSRSDNDLLNREAAVQRYAQQAVAGQRGNLAKSTALAPVRIVEGVSRPLWLGDRLVLARRVQIGNELVVQGCWLDWDKLQERLRAEVADLLPNVELSPLSAAEPIKLSRLLATLPVQLSVPKVDVPRVGWTPIRVSLAIAWTCLLSTAVMAAVLLHRVVALSERRGAFVSAVTHELRTPLTTFRMYAEMLAEGMVPEADQRQRYLETLRVEADRLSHLVENVLQYARLERGRPGKRRENVSLAELLHRSESRLAERAAQAEMKLLVEVADEDRGIALATDSAAVEQILFNLVDNACKYAAGASNRRIHLSLAAQARQVAISVRDHGPGISRTASRKLFQPFSKSVHEAASTAPGVGLGLALSKRLAADLGGKLELESPAGGGAAFVLTLPR